MLGKIILYIVAICSLCGSVLLRNVDFLDEKYDEMKYVSGGYSRKNTHTFGIRRFEIITKTEDPEKHTSRCFLYDTQGFGDIEFDIYRYQEINPIFYIIGREGYTKLNYETAEVIQCKKIEKFSKEDRDIFGNISS